MWIHVASPGSEGQPAPPGAGSELDDYCTRMYHLPALRKLKMEAILRKVTLPELIGQMAMNLEEKI